MSRELLARCHGEKNNNASLFLSGLSTRQHTNTKLLLESAAYNLFCPRKAQDCSRASFCCADESAYIFSGALAEQKNIRPPTSLLAVRCTQVSEQMRKGEKQQSQ